MPICQRAPASTMAAKAKNGLVVGSRKYGSRAARRRSPGSELSITRVTATA